jgi:hypothetical protein
MLIRLLLRFLQHLLAPANLLAPGILLLCRVKHKTSSEIVGASLQQDFKSINNVR